MTTMKLCAAHHNYDCPSLLCQFPAHLANHNHERELMMTDVDMVNHPPHYRHPSGVQCIEISRLCHGDLSAAIQYIWRYDAKGTPEQDLAKARWYLLDMLAHKLAPRPPAKAEALLRVVTDAETNHVKRRLLEFVASGHLADAIATIDALVWED